MAAVRAGTLACAGTCYVRRSVNPRIAATLLFDSGQVVAPKTCPKLRLAKPGSIKGLNTQALFCIEPGIPCHYAREQASELMGCVRDMTLAGVLEGNEQMMWAAHYLSALAKALMDDAELGMKH